MAAVGKALTVMAVVAEVAVVRETSPFRLSRLPSLQAARWVD